MCIFLLKGMLGKIKLMFIDVVGFYSDVLFYLNGSLNSVSRPKLI
jgi:hypothetical protein